MTGMMNRIKSLEKNANVIASQYEAVTGDDSIPSSDENLSDLLNQTSDNAIMKGIANTPILSSILSTGLRIAENSYGNEQISGALDSFDRLPDRINVERAKAISKLRQYAKSNNKWLEIRSRIIDKDLSGIETSVTNFNEKLINNFTLLYNVYNKNKKNISHINNMLEMKENTLFDIIRNIEFYEKRHNVDIRNNLYNFERLTLYNNIFSTIKIIYYLIFVIYIFFSNFIKDKIYTKVYFYIIAIIYLILPFTLKYIFAGIIFIYEYILRLFGNNKPILSYSDIVRANNIDNIYTAPVPNILNKNEITQRFRRFVRRPHSVQTIDEMFRSESG